MLQWQLVAISLHQFSPISRLRFYFNVSLSSPLYFSIYFGRNLPLWLVRSCGLIFTCPEVDLAMFV